MGGLCRELASSSEFAGEVMRARRMSFRSKLVMLKYLEKLRRLTFSTPQSWRLDEN